MIGHFVSIAVISVLVRSTLAAPLPPSWAPNRLVKRTPPYTPPPPPPPYTPLPAYTPSAYLGMPAEQPITGPAGSTPLPHQRVTLPAQSLHSGVVYTPQRHRSQQMHPSGLQLPITGPAGYTPHPGTVPLGYAQSPHSGGPHRQATYPSTNRHVYLAGPHLPNTGPPGHTPHPGTVPLGYAQSPHFGGSPAPNIGPGLTAGYAQSPHYGGSSQQVYHPHAQAYSRTSSRVAPSHLRTEISGSTSDVFIPPNPFDDFVRYLKSANFGPDGPWTASHRLTFDKVVWPIPVSLEGVWDTAKRTSQLDAAWSNHYWQLGKNVEAYCAFGKQVRAVFESHARTHALSTVADEGEKKAIREMMRLICDTVSGPIRHLDTRRQG